MKDFLNTIVYSHHRITIKVREIIISIFVVVFLLFFGLRSCTNNTEYLQRMDALEDTCAFPKDNINRLFDLLERADICSTDDWFSDYDDYIIRITEQNELLIDIKSEKHQDIYDVQVKLLDAMENFRDKQNEETLTKLQEEVENYQGLYSGICKGGITQS
jgi:hypothetical protein